MSNFINIRPMGAKAFHADGHTDRQTWQNETNNLFLQFCPKRAKNAL